jgi:hypothetical protein
MESQYAIVPCRAQDASRQKGKGAPFPKERGVEAASHFFGTRFLTFLAPLIWKLDEQVDKRIVRTMIQAVEAILSFRDRANGLLLSELGDAMDGVGGGGGTKRLGRLIHHQHWHSQLIEDFLLFRADEAVRELEEQGEDVLLIHDGTPWEKPESLVAEGLCAVRSQKAKRFTRIKPGYYNPPRGPIFVPGLHGIALILASRHKGAGVVQLAALRWWTSRGAWASFERDEHLKLFRTAHHLWGRRVIHVFDQGLCGAPWLGALRHFDARFVLRWNKKFHLLSQEGIKQPPWHFGRGKKGLQERQIFDAVKKQTVGGNVLFFPVTHPDFPDWPLTLVISRRKNGKPWYLLTNEPVETADDAWRIALSYIRRWQIELTIRNVKSELAIASPRVYEWEVRLKLLGLATLAYAFLMELMREPLRVARDWLMDLACHRTGTHVKEAAIPFTRVRIALAKVWIRAPCPFTRRKPICR